MLFTDAESYLPLEGCSEQPIWCEAFELGIEESSMSMERITEGW